MNRRKALLFVSTLTIAAALLNSEGCSKKATMRAPAAGGTYPLWDGNESVADYAKRAGIKDAQITLALDGNVTLKLTLIPAGRTSSSPLACTSGWTTTSR